MIPALILFVLCLIGMRLTPPAPKPKRRVTGLRPLEFHIIEETKDRNE